MMFDRNERLMYAGDLCVEWIAWQRKEPVPLIVLGVHPDRAIGAGGWRHIVVYAPNGKLGVFAESELLKISGEILG